VTRPPQLRVLLAAAVVGTLVVGGCSSSADEPTADPTPSGSSPGGSTATAAAAECQVTGYVPSTKLEVRQTRPVVVYAHRVSLAPATGMRDPSLELARADIVALKVRPDDASVRLTAAVRRQILVSGSGPVDTGTLADTVSTPVRIMNNTKRDQRYFVYRGSFVHTGEWAVKVCGAPYNDGTRVDRLTGTYSTVTRIRPVRTAGCGAPASDSEIDRYAARRACQDF
jgi:hypothetical protein